MASTIPSGSLYTPYTPYSAMPLLAQPRRMEPSVTASASAAPSSSTALHRGAAEGDHEGESATAAASSACPAALLLADSLGRIGANRRLRGGSPGPAPSLSVLERATRRRNVAPYSRPERPPPTPQAEAPLNRSLQSTTPGAASRFGPSKARAVVRDDVEGFHTVPEVLQEASSVLPTPPAAAEYEGVPVFNPSGAHDAHSTPGRGASTPSCASASRHSGPRSGEFHVVKRPHRVRGSEARMSAELYIPSSLLQSPPDVDPDVLETESALRQHALELRRQERRRRRIGTDLTALVQEAEERRKGMEEDRVREGGKESGRGDPLRPSRSSRMLPIGREARGVGPTADTSTPGAIPEPRARNERLRSSRSSRRMLIDAGEKTARGEAEGGGVGEAGDGESVRGRRREGKLQSLLSWDSKDNDLLKEIGAAVAATQRRKE